MPNEIPARTSDTRAARPPRRPLRREAGEKVPVGLISENQPGGGQEEPKERPGIEGIIDRILAKKGKTVDVIPPSYPEVGEREFTPEEVLQTIAAAKAHGGISPRFPDAAVIEAEEVKESVVIPESEATARLGGRGIEDIVEMARRSERLTPEWAEATLERAERLDHQIEHVYTEIREERAKSKATRYERMVTVRDEDGELVQVPFLKEKYREFHELSDRKVQQAGERDLAKKMAAVHEAEERRAEAKMIAEEQIRSGERIDINEAPSFSLYTEVLDLRRTSEELHNIRGETQLKINSLQHSIDELGAKVKVHEDQLEANPAMKEREKKRHERLVFIYDQEKSEFENEKARLEFERGRVLQGLRTAEANFRNAFAGGGTIATDQKRIEDAFVQEILPKYLKEAKLQGDPPYIDEAKVKKAFTEMFIALRVGDPQKVSLARQNFDALIAGAAQVDANLQGLAGRGDPVGNLQGAVQHYYESAQRQFNSLLASNGRFEDLPTANEGEFNPRDLNVTYIESSDTRTENPQGYYFRIYANTPEEMKIAADSFIDSAKRGTYGKHVGSVLQKFNVFKEAIGNRTGELVAAMEEETPEQVQAIKDFEAAVEVIRLKLESQLYFYADDHAINEYDDNGSVEAKTAMFGDQEAKKRLASLSTEEDLMAAFKILDSDPRADLYFRTGGDRMELAKVHNIQSLLQGQSEEDIVQRLMRIQLKDYIEGRDPTDPSKEALEQNRSRVADHQSDSKFWNYYEGADGAFWNKETYDRYVEGVAKKRDRIEKVEYQEIERRRQLIERGRATSTPEGRAENPLVQPLTPQEQAYLNERGRVLTQDEEKMLRTVATLRAKRDRGTNIAPQERARLQQKLNDPNVRNSTKVKIRARLEGLTEAEKQYLKRTEALTPEEQTAITRRDNLLRDQAAGRRLSAPDRLFLKNEGNAKLTSYEKRALRLKEDEAFKQMEEARAKATLHLALEMYGSTGELAQRAAAAFLVKRMDPRLVGGEQRRYQGILQRDKETKKVIERVMKLREVDLSKLKPEEKKKIEEELAAKEREYMTKQLSAADRKFLEKNTITEAIAIPESQKYVQFIASYTEMKYANHPAAVRFKKVQESVQYATDLLFRDGLEAKPLDPDTGRPIQLASTGAGAARDATFEDVLTHPFGMWLSITYSNTQEEIRHEMLEEVSVRDPATGALTKKKPVMENRDRILASVIMPTDTNADGTYKFGVFRTDAERPDPISMAEVDPLSAHAAIIDKTRQLQGVQDQYAENIITAAAHEGSYLNHYYINQVLYKKALDESDDFADTRVYYGLQDFGAWNKLAMNVQALAASDVNSFARRASDLIPYLPLTWSSLPEQMGAKGMMGLFGLLRRQNAEQKSLQTETFGNFSLARYANQAKAMGGVLKTLLGYQDWQGFADIEGFLEKTFNSDFKVFKVQGKIGQNDSHYIPNVEDEVAIIEAWLGSMGRYIKFNQAVVLFENYRKSRRGLDLRGKEMWIDPNDHSKGLNPGIFRDDSTGSSRHILSRWHDSFMGYWFEDTPRGAKTKYPFLQRLRNVMVLPQAMQILNGTAADKAAQLHIMARDQGGVR